MKKWLIGLFIIIFSGAVLFQLRVPHLLLAIYLSPSDDLSPADAIVVVSGDTGRISHAIDLYKQGLASKIILSGAAEEGFTSNAFAMHIEASEAGVPDEVVIMEEKAKNTYENAVYVKELIQKNNFKNLILVSSPYHQRRVYETFNYIFKDLEVTFQNSPSPYSKWNKENWWMSDDTRSLTYSEAIKVIGINIIGKYK